MPQLISLSQTPTPKRPIITTCPHCNCTLSYMEDEIERVDNDAMGVLCPNCEEPIVTKRITPFTFPETFSHMTSGNPVSNEKIQEMVNETLNTLSKSDLSEYACVATGDVIVFGCNLEDEVEIIVARNYWTDSIFKE